MKKILFVFVILSYSIIINAQAITLRIDPFESHGANASQIFDEVNYIPLETTKESLFGRIDQLEVTDKYFVVLDDNTNSILIFDKKGKFHAKIKGGDINTNYKNRLGSFKIVPSKNLIECHSMFATQIKTYDFEGKKVSEKKVDFNFLDYHHFPDDSIAYYNYLFPMDNNKDSILNEIWLVKNNKEYQHFLPYNIKRVNLTSGEIMLSSDIKFFYSSGNDTSVFFLRPYDYTVYELTAHSLLPRFNFILPLVNSLPKNFTTDPSYNGKHLKTFMDNNNIVYNLGYTYLLNDNLFFKLIAYNGLEHNNSFIYNLKSGDLIGINHILPDSSTYYLPITDDGLGGDFLISNFLTCDGKYIYTAYSSLILFNIKKSSEDKNINYPPILKSYFETETRKSNPVIVQLKPKENL